MKFQRYIPCRSPHVSCSNVCQSLSRLNVGLAANCFARSRGATTTVHKQPWDAGSGNEPEPADQPSSGHESRIGLHGWRKPDSRVAPGHTKSRTGARAPSGTPAPSNSEPNITKHDDAL